MRVTARDNAGNVAAGQPDAPLAHEREGRQALPPRPLGPREDPVRPSATLRGRLTLSAGQSFAGQTIVATSAVRKGGARSRPRVPWSPTAAAASRSRSPRARAAPTGSSSRAPAERSAGPRRVRPRPGLEHYPRVAHPPLGAGRVRFSGRLRTRGQRIPGRGLVLILQGYDNGKWRTFQDMRTNSKGRWRVSYGFSGAPGAYPIRVRIRKQAGFPFELGYSRRLTIRVG